MSPIEEQPDRRPDLRAIVNKDGRLIVVPWRADLNWAEFQAGPVNRDPVFGLPGPSPQQGQAVFEVWRDGADCFARQIGDAPDTERPAAGRNLSGTLSGWSGPLRHWVEEQGGSLALGHRLPDLTPAPTPIDLPYRHADRPPDFRFVFQPELRGRLRITPWGFTDLGLDQLREPWDGAVGDVIASDRDTAVALFARNTPHSRLAAERALLSWAARDGWNLHFSPGVVPLIQPSPPPHTHAPYCVCEDCGARLSTGWASHVRFGGSATGQGFQRTRCRTCGGRYIWFEKRPGRPPLP